MQQQRSDCAHLTAQLFPSNKRSCQVAQSWWKELLSIILTLGRGKQTWTAHYQLFCKPHLNYSNSKGCQGLGSLQLSPYLLHLICYTPENIVCLCEDIKYCFVCNCLIGICSKFDNACRLASVHYIYSYITNIDHCYRERNSIFGTKESAVVISIIAVTSDNVLCTWFA